VNPIVRVVGGAGARYTDGNRIVITIFVGLYYFFYFNPLFPPTRSMVVPEKASSFNIHPERCCSDTCHYCATKFGILDTPLHVSQLKTPEIQRFAMEFASVTADACLCDKCFRYIDRKAKEMRANKNAAVASHRDTDEKEKRESKEERMKTCVVRTCNREVRAESFKN